MNRPFFRNMAFFHMKRYIFMSASSPQEKIVNYLLTVRNIFIKVLPLNGLSFPNGIETYFSEEN